ncbi:MAG: PDDEXK nuclease domain-containing protein [Prevotellaceae bacterium]|jgi:predicted nuclease of restriction endonuclease-like (RecB) superfamily|nr:PDDEXK nuclease domain-containing protein [Prevotellaceae bacterium]
MNEIKHTDIAYIKSDNLLQDAQHIIEKAQHFAYRAVNTALLQRNWLLGKRIAEEVLQGEDRAKYGAEIVKKLSVTLTQIYGNSFTKTNLYNYTEFYSVFPEIFHTACGKFSDNNFTALRIKSFSLLTWSHFRALLQVKDADARSWYMQEAAEQAWSVRTLQRNISSQYYFRLLQSQSKDLVKAEMEEKTSSFQQDKLEFIKNPVIAEFLGFTPNSDFTESELEKTIITNLQKFMVELGKGFAFVARQQHVRTEKQDYFVDLVFYNYILKCFVLIDLKTTKITHQDVGQMDMYIRMYDELKLTEGDNPTLGIVLCADTDEDIARYSILHGNEQLFASKYKIYMPSEEELRAEIEAQKRLFYLQRNFCHSADIKPSLTR